MSTKNLARTAIEAGRRTYNKWERNYSHKQERVRAKNYISRVTKDPELADDIVVKARPKVPREQGDKLNPIRGYLRSRVGRKWDDVHSEIIKRFDTRTIAGHHILYGHILEHMVAYWYVLPYGRYADFIVNEDGILTEGPDWRHRYTPQWVSWDHTKFDSWLGNRRILVAGNEVFWTSAMDPIWGSRRQEEKLSKEDRVYWDSLPDRAKGTALYPPPEEKDRKRYGFGFLKQR
jgi:hypothetical protein